MKKPIWLPVLAVFLLLLAFNGCMSDSVTSSENAGVLQGKVTIGPLCPVEHPDQDCSPDPSIYTSHYLVILTADGNIASGHVAIASDGKYQTELSPGHYLVDYAPKDIGIAGRFSPLDAVVEAGKTTVLNIDIDTGIR
jgi:hypothetical protein